MSHKSFDKVDNTENVENVEKTDKPEKKEKEGFLNKSKEFFAGVFKKKESGEDKKDSKESDGSDALKKIEEQKKAFHDRLKVSPEELKKGAEREKMKEQQKKNESDSDSGIQHGEDGERTKYSDKKQQEKNKEKEIGDD